MFPKPTKQDPQSKFNLRFLHSSLTMVELEAGDFSWIDTLRYAVDGSGTDREILGKLIDVPGYAHSYAAPRANPLLAESPDYHGPYWRKAISEHSYQPISHHTARRELETWIYAPGSLSAFGTEAPLGPDAPSLEQAIATSSRVYEDSVGRVNPDISVLVDRVLAESHRLYRLDDLRAAAEHDWGWVVGAGGFIEIAAVSEHSEEVTLLVASDD